MRFLSVLASYRQHQKFFRFAHRVFNRISILHDEEQMRLSSQAGTLYQLPTADEVTEGENRIVHHAILKADVRGSTTVTDELEKKDLNPASYFSLRFFGPINKVFIVGDAVILSFLEYENPPSTGIAWPMPAAWPRPCSLWSAPTTSVSGRWACRPSNWALACVTPTTRHAFSMMAIPRS